MPLQPPGMQIKALQPKVKIVMITMSAEDQDLFEAIRSSASSYLLKNITGSDSIEALHNHMAEIIARLHLENRSQALAFAAQYGLVDPYNPEFPV